MPWPQATTRRLVEQAFAAQGLSCRVAAEAGGWELIKAYVALALGIGILPSCCLTKADRRGLGVRSATALFGRDTYGLLFRREHALSVASRKLLRLLAPQASSLDPILQNDRPEALEPTPI